MGETMNRFSYQRKRDFRTLAPLATPLCYLDLTIRGLTYLAYAFNP